MASNRQRVLQRLSPFLDALHKMALPSFTHCVAEAICFGLETELPLRGGDCRGRGDTDEGGGVFLGEPLVEVARTERSQQWIGASFGPSFMKPGFNDGFYLDTILPYKSHYKDISGEYSTGMTVDWPRRWRESRKSDPRPILRDLNSNPLFVLHIMSAPRALWSSRRRPRLVPKARTTHLRISKTRGDRSTPVPS